jgi:hypothetical protein
VAVGSQPTFSATQFPARTVNGQSCATPSDLPSLITYEACAEGEKPAPTVTACYPTNQTGQPVRVTVSATYSWIPWVNRGFANPTSSINGAATMRLENAVSGSWVPASSC